MDACVGVNENALGSEPLRAVAGDCIAMIEVAVLCGIEPAIGVNRLNDGKVSIGNPECPLDSRRAFIHGVSK